jgi:hypothetical protein
VCHDPDVSSRAPTLSRSTPPLRGGLRHPALVGGLLLIAVQLVFRGWAVSGSWFQFDDFAFLSRAYNSDLTWGYLTESYAGHLMPGGFLLTWLFAKVDPLGFWPYATTLLVLQAVASIGFLRLLFHMFGRRLAVLPLLAIYLFSVTSLPAFIWWAAGINQLPLQIALFFGLHSHVSYLRTRRSRHLAATMAWTVFGLLFYEKTLLVFVAYGLVALAYFAQGTLEERLRHLWTTYRRGLLLHGLLALGYLALYLSTSLTFAVDNANQTPVFPVAYRYIFVAFSTGVIGGPWQWTDLSPVGRVANPSDLVIFLSWLVIGYLIYLAYRTRLHSLRAWLLTALFLVANVFLLTAGRAFLVGAIIGLEYRYQTELSAVFALSVGLAFLPLVGAVETVRPREESGVPFRPESAALVFSVLFVGGAMVSNFQYAARWQMQNPAPAYFDRVAASLADKDQPVPLADLAVPQMIMWGFRHPENTYSRMFRLHEEKTRYPSIVSDELYVFDGRGRLRPALITPMRQNVPHEDSGCGYRLEDTSITIPLDDPVIGGGWWVRIGYFADGNSTVTVTAGDLVHEGKIERGLHSLYFQASGRFKGIRLSGLENGTSLCTNDVTLGLPKPVPQE